MYIYKNLKITITHFVSALSGLRILASPSGEQFSQEQLLNYQRRI